MFQLREDQKIALQELGEELHESKKVILRMPTGAGKTVCAGEIARRFHSLHPNRKGVVGLFVVHRKQLVAQTVEKLHGFGFGVEEVGVISAGWPERPWAMLQVATIQTLARRSDVLDPVFVVLDEAHHCRAKQYEIVLSRYPDAYLVGLTATPARLDGKGMGHIFNAIVEGASEQELTEIGALAPYRFAYVPTGLDMSGIHKRMGDYNRKEMESRITKSVIARVSQNYLKIAAGRPAIFFAVSIKHSQEVADELCQKGVRALHIDHTSGDTEINLALQNYAAGLIDVLCNVELFTEGIDAPRCEVVMLGRLTSSIVLYRQMCGRALRPRPGKEALIMDLSGCFYEHGLPDDPIVWSLDDGADLLDGGQYIKPRNKFRICHNTACAEVYPRTEENCPTCGIAAPVMVAAEMDVDLVVAKEGDIEPGLRKNRKGGMARLTAKQRRKIIDSGASLEVLLGIAKERGYKPSWARIVQKQYQRFGVGKK